MHSLVQYHGNRPPSCSALGNLPAQSGHHKTEITTLKRKWTGNTMITTRCHKDLDNNSRPSRPSRPSSLQLMHPPQSSGKAITKGELRYKLQYRQALPATSDNDETLTCQMFILCCSNSSPHGYFFSGGNSQKEEHEPRLVSNNVPSETPSF